MNPDIVQRTVRPKRDVRGCGLWFAALWIAVASAAAAAADTSAAPRLSQHYGFGDFQIYKLKPRIGLLRLHDLNGDGKTDIALWNDEQSRIEIFYQPGPKTPAPRAGARTLDRNDVPNRGEHVNHSVLLAFKVAAMEIADVTDDGRPDFICYGEAKQIIIAPGREGGFDPAFTIRAPEGEARAAGLACGDFNHDGKTDVALLGTDVIAVYPQKPGGGLAKPTRLYHGIKQPLFLMTADLNADQRQDLLITADDDQYGAYAYLQEDGGGFGGLRRLRVPRTRSMTIVPGAGGYRGSELLAVQQATSHLNLYRWGAAEREVAGDEWPLRIYSYPSKTTGKRRPIAIGDITSDGIADVVAGDPEGAQVVLFRGLPSGELAPGLAFPSLAKALDLCITDSDGDGRAELLCVSAEERAIGVMRWNEGRLTFPEPLAGTAGAPLAVAVGAAAENGADKLAYATRNAKKLELRVRPLKGGEEAVYPLEGAEEDPAGVRFADVDQDGRQDLLVFIKFSALRTFLQREDGTFSLLDEAGGRGALVKEAAVDGYAYADVTGDGRPEMLLAQKSFARALAVRDGRWTIIEQFNPENAEAQITGLAVIPASPGAPTASAGGGNPSTVASDAQAAASAAQSEAAGVVRAAAHAAPRVVLYERKARELVVLARRADGSFAVSQTMPAPGFDLSAMGLITTGARAGVLLADVDKLGVLEVDGVTPTLSERGSYETDIAGGWLSDAVVGDLNGDGVREIIAVDLGKAAIEVLAELPDSRLQRVQRFQVFHGKRYSEDPDVRGEPREVLCDDVTGDGRADIVLIAHDRLLIYPGQ